MRSPFGWDMPPGTSFRIDRSAADLECPKCGETTEVRVERDCSVNASEIVGGEVCRECGHEWTEKELDDADWGGGFDEEDAAIERAEAMRDDPDLYRE